MPQNNHTYRTRTKINGVFKMATPNKVTLFILTILDTTFHLMANVASRAKSDDTGEGVVSAAIAVLIFAFLGVILWVAFKATMGAATNSVNAQVAQLGQ